MHNFKSENSTSRRKIHSPDVSHYFTYILNRCCCSFITVQLHFPCDRSYKIILNFLFKWLNRIFNYKLKENPFRVSFLIRKLVKFKMQMETRTESNNCDLSCDDRKKVFDISHIHCLKTMSEISKLRSKSLLFDVVILSDGRKFQVNFSIQNSRKS